MSMGTPRKDQLLGKLDLLVLRTLATGQSMHGYAIAERIEQLSEKVLQVGEGSLYPALHRMDEAGWIRSGWAPSENNRRARYYKITAAGRRQLVDEQAEWLRAADAITRVLRLA
jgi:transcriptional regulator